MSGNGNGRVPVTWLLGLLTAIILGVGAALWRATDAKADKGQEVARIADLRSQLNETRIMTMNARLSEIVLELQRINNKLDEIRRR